MFKPTKGLTPQNHDRVHTVELLMTARNLDCTNKAHFAAQRGYYVTIFWEEALIAFETGLKVCLVLKRPFTKDTYSEIDSQLAGHPRVDLPDFETLTSKPASLESNQSRFLIISLKIPAVEDGSGEILTSWIMRRATSL